MTAMNKHIRGSAGFSLTEMLVALLVLMLFGALAIAVMNVATNVREDSTFVSDSDVLAGTINTALADCIHYNDSNSTQNSIWLHGKNIEDAKLVIIDGQFYVSGNYNGAPLAAPERLLNAGAYGNLEVYDDGILDDYNANPFSDGRVAYTIRSKINADLTKQVNVSYANLKTN